KVLSDLPHPGTDGLRSRVWIHSEKLTPGLVLPARQPMFGMMLSTNGLVLVDHGKLLRKCRAGTSLAMTRLWRDDGTGEVRSYDGYYEVFRSLKKVASKTICYTVIQPDGEEEAEPSMTERAAQAYRDGYPFCCKPGRRITRESRRKSRAKAE